MAFDEDRLPAVEVLAHLSQLDLGIVDFEGGEAQKGQ